MTDTPLWDDDRIIETIHNLGLRDNSPRINIDDAIDKMMAVRDDYEATIASLRQQLDESVPRSEVNAMIDNNRVSDAVTIDSLSHEIAQLKQQLELLNGEFALVHIDNERLVKQLADQTEDNNTLNSTQDLMESNMDVMVQRVRELEQQLAEHEAWEPVPDGEYSAGKLLVHVLAGRYVVATKAIHDDNGREYWNATSLPNEYRLCRRRTQGGVRKLMLSELTILVAIEALEFKRRWAQGQQKDSADPYYLGIVDEIDAAIAELQAMQQKTEETNA